MSEIAFLAVAIVLIFIVLTYFVWDIESYKSQLQECQNKSEERVIKFLNCKHDYEWLQQNPSSPTSVEEVREECMTGTAVKLCWLVYGGDKVIGSGQGFFSIGDAFELCVNGKCTEFVLTRTFNFVEINYLTNRWSENA